MMALRNGEIFFSPGWGGGAIEYLILLDLTI
jgi:hypothetical protein